MFTEHSILQQSADSSIVRLYLSFHTPNYLLLLLEYCSGGELFRLAAVQQQRLAEQCAPAPPHSLTLFSSSRLILVFQTRSLLFSRGAARAAVPARHRLRLS